MDPFNIALLCIVGMLALVFLGLPVAIAMCLVSAVGMYIAVGPTFAIATFKTLPFETASNFSFAAIPMFIAMGIIAGNTGIVGDVFKSANMWLSRVRGGLYMATTLASAAFGALNGSTIVGAVLFTRIALPEMMKLGYNKATSAGCIAAAGTFAAMIPPSISMIIYGILTGESIGKLLIAGIIPGILTAGVYLLGIFFAVRIRKDWAPQVSTSYPLRDRVRSLSTIWPIATLSIVVVGGIYTGAVSPSLAGAVGAAGAFIIALIMRRISWDNFSEGMRETITVSSVLFLIIIGGLLFSRLLLVTGFVTNLLTWIEALGLSPWALLLVLVVAYLILGMLMEPISMVVMTIPIVHPLLTALGFDGIWLAIIIIKLIEFSCITPPIGMNLFAVVGASRGKVSIREVYSGVLPFVILEMLILALLMAFPSITLILPSAMMG